VPFFLKKKKTPVLTSRTPLKNAALCKYGVTFPASAHPCSPVLEQGN